MDRQYRGIVYSVLIRTFVVSESLLLLAIGGLADGSAQAIDAVLATGLQWQSAFIWRRAATI